MKAGNYIVSREMPTLHVLRHLPVGVGTTLGILSRKDSCGLAVVGFIVVALVVAVGLLVVDVEEAIAILVLGFSRFFFLLVLFFVFDFLPSISTTSSSFELGAAASLGP